MRTACTLTCFAASWLTLLPAPTLSQVSVPPTPQPTLRPFAANVVVPQSASWLSSAAGPDSRSGAVRVTRVEVKVVINQQLATTTMDVHLQNPRGTRQEAELLIPVPDTAAIHGLDFQGAGREPSAQLLRKEEARAIYESLVSRVRDPALLEFAGCNLVRTSVFPVEANATQRVRLTYENLLTADGPRVDYVLPRSESLDYRVPWDIAVKIASPRPISTVYSPSHELQVIEKAPHAMSVSISKSAALSPGAFRLSYLVQAADMTASLLAYPDASIGGGYFLLLAGVPARPASAADGPAIRREVTLVIDQSGSMSGGKLEQAQAAAQQVIGGLRDGESFNIIAYSDSVQMFSPRPVIKDADSARKATAYIRGLRAMGGTNIHDALTEALRIRPMDEMLPIVLFLTDGLPTVGQTSEVAIRDVAIKANPHKRRIFTFGVGVDVNTPLLERLANETRGVPTFILPGEDVEVKVAALFKRLNAPVLADPTLVAATPDGSQRVSDVMPAPLPDLFEDDQLVVVGRYKGDQDLRFELSGNFLGTRRAFAFEFSLESASTTHAFVPRLWASRRIASLVDAIRQLGAEGGAVGGSSAAASDPRTKELVDEIVRLSLQFGILTEYTAFLAREGTDLSDRSSVVLQAGENLDQKAVRMRSGKGAVSQSLNVVQMSKAKALNVRNEYIDENLQQVSIANVQQVNDGAFYLRKGKWVESRIAGEKTEPAPRRTVAFASREYFDIAGKLAAENRQSSMTLRGDVVLTLDGEPVLIQGPTDDR